MQNFFRSSIMILFVSLVRSDIKELDSCDMSKNVNVDICTVGNVSYIPPLPVLLDTRLYLIEIVKIDGNENSISIFVELSTFWKDSKIVSGSSE